MNTLANWLALWLAPRLSSTLFKKVASACVDSMSSPDFFKQAQSLLQNFAASELTLQYCQQPNWPAVQRALTWAEQPQHHIITWRDPAYPPLLQQIVDAPPILFLRGNLSLLKSPQIAIVGSRNPSHYGIETAYQFAHALAQQGMSITSGLALGIDAASHRGALAAMGHTLAVFGTGADTIYPASHRHLAEQIAEQGLLISEQPLKTTAKPFHFPKRNRIISGLSMGVLVVEAAPRSGSLITARLANEQGRNVFALPGSIYNPLSRGSHALIKEGAILVESVDDILAELHTLLPFTDRVAPRTLTRVTKTPADKTSERLLNAIDFTATPFDLVVQRSGLHTEAVAAALLKLEVAGYIKSVTGGFIKTLSRIN